MELQTRKGESKLVAECSYPLTGLRCVSRVYTDVGVFALGPQGARVIELVDGVSLDEVRGLTGLPLAMAACQPRERCDECRLHLRFRATAHRPLPIGKAARWERGGR